MSHPKTTSGRVLRKRVVY